MRVDFLLITTILISCQASKANIEEKSVVDAKKHRHTFEAQKVKRDGVLGE